MRYYIYQITITGFNPHAPAGSVYTGMTHSIIDRMQMHKRRSHVEALRYAVRFGGYKLKILHVCQSLLEARGEEERFIRKSIANKKTVLNHQHNARLTGKNPGWKNKVKSVHKAKVASSVGIPY